MRHLFRRLSRLVVPMACAGCDAPLTDDPVPFFCRACWAGIRPLQGPACPRCRRPFGSANALAFSPTHECQDCRVNRPAYAHVWAAYAYAPPLQDAIALFKYRGKVALAPALGTLLLRAVPDHPAIDLLMPVPLHPERLRRREFNQSLLLADHVHATLGIPLSYRNLVRTTDTAPQTTLPRAARLRNLHHAFALRRPDEVSGARILLIDDVFTTGATAAACSRLLMESGAQHVTVLTLARSVDRGMLPDAALPAAAFNQDLRA